MDDQCERNKQNVAAFYDMMFNQCNPAEAVRRYVGDVCVQHNPHVADGKDAFIDYFERMAKKYPGKRVRFKRIVRGGNYVLDDTPDKLVSWNRTVAYRNPATGQRQIGFRCAANA